MLLRLFLLFTIVPMIELTIIIKIGQHLGAGLTIGLLILSGVVGAALAKHEGLRTLRAIQNELAGGRMPTDRLIDALLILVAGVLMVAPGFLTDTIGVLLLIPPIRSLVRRYLKKRFAAKIVVNRFDDFRPPGGDEFIDVEAHSEDE
jgi:UPF0716 protein FxsA